MKKIEDIITLLVEYRHVIGPWNQAAAPYGLLASWSLTSAMSPLDSNPANYRDEAQTCLESDRIRRSAGTALEDRRLMQKDRKDTGMSPEMRF
jgi:hypothetical protein